MRAGGHFHYSDLGRLLQARFRTAQQQVVLIAPFITRAAFDYVLEAIPPDTETLVYTRWRVDEVAASFSDPSILDVLTERGNAALHLHDALHAKAYSVDSTILLCGSANVTQTALGLSANPNIEHLTEIAPIPTAFFLMLRRLHRESKPATKALQQDVLKRAEVFRANMPSPWFPLTRQLGDGQEADTAVQAFPRFRSPEQLYAAYGSLAEIAVTETRETVIDDLLLLEVQSGLDTEAFVEEVRQSLLQLPVVQKLDSFLDKPRRFGELTQWVKTAIPEDAEPHEEAQRCAQTIIRWLTYFAADRYGCEPRSYSEILFRK